MEETMKGYKAFEKGMICRGKQYAENTTFEEESAKICESGMHFCESPLDCLDYYPLIDDNCNWSEYAEVEAENAHTDDEIKYVTTKLKVGKKLSLSEFIMAAVDMGKARSSNNAASGGGSNLAASGDYSQLAASGDGSKLVASGDASKLAASGYHSKLAASGDYSKLAAEGKNCVLMCAGAEGWVKASLGSWITLAEWGFDSGGYIPKCVKTARVDGTTIKADTFYTLTNGEFVEVE